MRKNRFSNWRRDFRIIRSITAKDILEAVKNRYAFGVVIVALFISISYSYIPALTALDNQTNVLVFNEGNSQLGAKLKASQALEVYTYPSKEVMLSKLAAGEVPELGLVIPASFDQTETSEGASVDTQVLTGYVLYWVNQKEISRLTQEVEAELTRLNGEPVKIQMAGERVIPFVSQNSLSNWIGAALVFLLIYTSLGLISNLMLEEKLTCTMDVLLVSPASTWHIVMGKVNTGLFYCFLGVMVTLAINYKIVLNWWILIPTLIIGMLFTISLGLIAGALVDERGQLSLWTFGLLIPLFIPVFLSNLNELFPRWINQVFMMIPSVTLNLLIQSSFSRIPPLDLLFGQFAWLIAWATLGITAAIWILHRQQLSVSGKREANINKIGKHYHESAKLHAPISTSSSGEVADLKLLQSIPLLDENKFVAKPPSWLHIVEIIAAKDIRQSLHNKLILSIVLGTTILVAGNALLVRGLSAYTGAQSNLIATSSSVISIMICTTLMTLGVSLVPLLMVEEKEAHTLETLLISPARYLQVLAGKALAGSVYCLSGILVILIAYRFLIVHWEIALLALLLGTTFVVAVGLLLGVIMNNPTSIGIWAAVVMFILIIPPVLAGLGNMDLAPWLEAILDYWPSTAILQLFNYSMVVVTPQQLIIRNVFTVITAAIVLYLASWWMVRRGDR